MTDEQLTKGKELKDLIKVTEFALINLYEIKPRERLDGRFYEDEIYNLAICEYGDGSGKKGDLSRYYGNERLLKLIIEELEVQLREFKEWFAKL